MWSGVTAWAIPTPNREVPHTHPFARSTVLVYNRPTSLLAAPMMPIRRSIALVAVLLATRVAAQQTEGTPPIPVFDKTETMVAMRDGVKLHTNVFVPRGFAGNLPIIMVRTPYGIEGGERSFAGAYAELARDGYIFVHQDIRG